LQTLDRVDQRRRVVSIAVVNRVVGVHLHLHHLLLLNLLLQ
jgi:hypothetical protein